MLAVVATLGYSEPLTTRETGAVIGTVGGAAAGGIIGSAVGHPGAAVVVNKAALPNLLTASLVRAVVLESQPQENQ